MSRLDELIKELCPNGVEYKELGEIAKVTIGEFVHKDKQSENAEYPVFNGGISNTGYYNDYNEEKDKIIMSARGANAGYINRVFVNYWAGNSCYTINTNDEIMNWNFLYYVLKNKEKNILNEQQTGSIPSISKKQVEGILVPVPPLEVQEEIVRILDNFTALTAELTARKKQYSWYRDYLLTFENKVEKSKLSEVAAIKARIGWQGLTKEEYLITGNYYLITGTDFQNGEINLKNCYYVNEERYIQDKNIQLKNDDVLVTKDGTLGKVAYVSNLDKPATLNSGIFVIRSIDTNKLLNRYLFHYLKAPYLMKYAQNKLTGGTIKHLNQNVIVDFEIPLPPLEVQKRIVEVLDNFEKTCKELNIELSSEIEIKQKEYEFIRNYLLTFEEKSRQAILACELASLRACELA
jgi:anti-codon nuclease masking agent